MNIRSLNRSFDFVRLKSTFSLLLLLLYCLNYTNGGKCPFGHGADSKDEQIVKLESEESSTSNAGRRKLAKKLYPSDILVCKDGKKRVEQTDSSFTIYDYEQVVSVVIAAFNKIPDVHSDNKNERASFAGCLVRTAGHDFMDFRIDG